MHGLYVQCRLLRVAGGTGQGKHAVSVVEFHPEFIMCSLCKHSMQSSHGVCKWRQHGAADAQWIFDFKHHEQRRPVHQVRFMHAWDSPNICVYRLHTDRLRRLFRDGSIRWISVEWQVHVLLYDAGNHDAVANADWVFSLHPILFFRGSRGHCQQLDIIPDEKGD
jgi:hypothetical protein